MAAGKSSIIIELEQSLINFLSQKREIDDLVNGGTRRVKGLTFNIDAKNPQAPLFTVQIGMCEATFSGLSGLKEKGSCFGLERFIRDWFERPSVKEAIKAYVIDSIKK